MRRGEREALAGSVDREQRHPWRRGGGHVLEARDEVLPLLGRSATVDAHGDHAARPERSLQRVEHPGVMSEDEELGAAGVTAAPSEDMRHGPALLGPTGEAV